MTFFLQFNSSSINILTRLVLDLEVLHQKVYGDTFIKKCFFDIFWKTRSPFLEKFRKNF